MEFKEFKQRLQESVSMMLEGQEYLFVTAAERDKIWETYLESFPEGTNLLYRERREYDCSNCRHFVKTFGNAVVIKDNRLMSIWDLPLEDGKFSVVARVLSEYVKGQPVQDVLVTKTVYFGADKSHEMTDAGVKTWEHLHVNLPRRFVLASNGKSESSVAASFRDTKNVFQRALEELTDEAFETVLDLISENTLYRGEEWQEQLHSFLEIKHEYAALDESLRDNFCWIKSTQIGPALGRIRNHSIGVLLQDISSGVDVEAAVRKYEQIVAPSSYKRPKAIFTKKMVEEAQETVRELGFEDSLQRRHAVLSDITINNVLWADRDAKAHMDGVGGIFEALKGSVPEKPSSYDHAPVIPIEEFMRDILPNSTSLQVLLENRHEGNFMSLVAPVHKDAPSMFMWDNGFSWAYKGNITDSMKQRVKAAGGNVDGVLRASLQWNTQGDNQNDYDLHCVQPVGHGHIFYQNKGRRWPTSGMLDVDIIHPGANVAVENVIWTSLKSMPAGDYSIFIHCYSHNGGRSGFDAEIEFEGQIHEFAYHKNLAQDEKVPVAVVHLDQYGRFTITPNLESSISGRSIWKVQTNQFQPVSVVMYSPNYWDGQKGIGNRHYFFMLPGCLNDSQPNGFFNEFLNSKLLPHKRVFEALGGMMKVPPADDQLSGLGFSSTISNSLIVKSDDTVRKIIF